LKNENAIDWLEQKLAMNGAYALLGKMKNKMADE
jgi:hypothetical protein